MSNWGTSLQTARTADQLIPEFQFVRRMGGGGAPVQEFQEAATQTFVAGQCVYLVAASGQLAEASDGLDRILGVALKPASGTTGTLIPVILGLEDVVFLATATTPANVAQTLVGTYVDLDVTAGVHTVDENDSADDVFRVVGLPVGATDSTHVNYGKLYVTIHSSQVAQTPETSV